MANPNFAQNLRTICNQHRSVAHVCRSLEMNRQQFNKYLSGQIYPSKHNLSRICKFFKLDESQLCLSRKEFVRLVADSPGTTENSGIGEVEQIINSLPNVTESLARYEGYYYSHFHALVLAKSTQFHLEIWMMKNGASSTSEFFCIKPLVDSLFAIRNPVFYLVATILRLVLEASMTNTFHYDCYWSCRASQWGKSSDFLF